MMIEAIIEKTCQDMERKMKETIQRNKGKSMEESKEKIVVVERYQGKNMETANKKIIEKRIRKNSDRSIGKIMKTFVEKIMKVGLL